MNDRKREGLSVDIEQDRGLARVATDVIKRDLAGINSIEDGASRNKVQPVRCIRSSLRRTVACRYWHRMEPFHWNMQCGIFRIGHASTSFPPHTVRPVLREPPNLGLNTRCHESHTLNLIQHGHDKTPIQPTGQLHYECHRLYSTRLSPYGFLCCGPRAVPRSCEGTNEDLEFPTPMSSMYPSSISDLVSGPRGT